MNRSYKMKKNIISNIIMFLLATIMSFVVRTVFIKTLGETSLGLSSLYLNILSMLNLSELGLSTAVGFSLYKKLADKDYKNVSILLSFYKKVYRIIGIIILVAGLILLPFLKNFINGEIVDNYQLIFLLYLLDVVVSYFVCYNSVLIESDQNAYKALKVKFFGTLLMYVSEILILYLTNNFVLYAVVFFITNNLSKIFLNIYITRKYKYIDFNNKELMNTEEKKSLTKNIKAMLFHKLGDYLVNSTDNIIISKMINLATVGFYVNYLSLISIFKSLISTLYGAISSSVGNLLVTENEKISLNSYKITEFVSFVFSGLFTIGFYFCSNLFIELWIGEKYVLSNAIVLVISINFYLYCILLPVNSFKNAAGLYDEDKYYALLQALINLIFSIFLAKFYGLLGVILGTTISYILTVNWIKPKIIYSKIFKCSSKEYFVRQLKNLIITILIFTFINVIITNIIIESSLIKMFLNGIIVVIVYFIGIYLFYRKTYEYKYILNNIKNKLFH